MCRIKMPFQFSCITMELSLFVIIHRNYKGNPTALGKGTQRFLQQHCGHYCRLTLSCNDCAKTHLDGRVVNTFAFPLATIAHFNSTCCDVTLVCINYKKYGLVDTFRVHWNIHEVKVKQSTSHRSEYRGLQVPCQQKCSCISTLTNQNHHKWHHLNSDWSSSDFQVLFADNWLAKQGSEFAPPGVSWDLGMGPHCSSM